VDQDVEFVKDFVKRNRSHSTDRDARSKKLRDELLGINLDEFYAQPEPEKRDRFAEFLFMKTQVVLLCFLFWILAVAMALFFTSRVQNSFTKPLPT